MNRIMIIGNAGGGKSRLANEVSHKHNLPLTRLDDLMWQPGWQRTADAAFSAQHDAILTKPRWLIDGYGPADAITRRIVAADTIIFVDLPFRTHLWWASKRQFKSIFTPQGPQGCPMWRKTLPLYAMMWDLHKNARPKLLAQLQSAAQARLIHVTSVKQLNQLALNPI